MSAPDAHAETEPPTGAIDQLHLPAALGFLTGAGLNPRSVRGAIYGTIIVTAVVAGSSESVQSATKLVGLAIATSVVYWLAHVYCELIEAFIEARRRPSLRLIGRTLAQEWPIVQAGLLPVLGLLFGVAGVLDDGEAVDLALALGIIDLTVWGLILGLRQHLRWPGVLLTGGLNALFGGLIVAIKVAI